MKNCLSVHRCGFMRKSGNNLWRTRIGVGSSLFVGTMIREWRNRSVVDIFDTPRRSERAVSGPLFP